MKRILISLSAVAMLLAPSSASAQGSGTSNKVIDTKFILITSSLVASTVFDAETTFAALKNPRVSGAHEANPIMRPFVNAGRPATYAFLGGVDTGIVYISYRMKKNTNPAVRKLWWVMPVAVITSHAFAGGFNLRFTFH